MVCAHNGWNPYADEVKQLPSFYWIMAFFFSRLKIFQEWEGLYKSNAELIGMLTHPEIYEVYRKQLDASKKGGSREIHSGDKTYTEANAHLDPILGLVDKDGKVIIPKDEMDKMQEAEGIALGF